MTHPHEHFRKAKVIGNMPPFYEVAEAIWGRGVDIDSDGDSSHPEDTNWRELTVTLRPDCDQRLDIDPTEKDRDIVFLRATSHEILERALDFLEGVGALARADR